MADIQEIPLDIAEEVEVILENIAEIKADEEPEPPQEAPASEAEVIKPRAKGRPKGALTKGHASHEQKIFEYKKLLWKKSPRHTSPPLQRGISNCRRIRALVMSRLPC